MKRYIFGLLIFGTISTFAQIKAIEPVDKFIRFSKSDSIHLRLQTLDSLYMSAINVVDKSKCVFPDMDDTVYVSWKAFLNNVAKTLKEKNFIWPNETKVFIRCYFNENGNIDYFFYNILDTTFIRHKEFVDALRDLSTSYNFGLKSDKKYSQCGSAIFGKKK